MVQVYNDPNKVAVISVGADRNKRNRDLDSATWRNEPLASIKSTIHGASLPLLAITEQIKDYNLRSKEEQQRAMIADLLSSEGASPATVELARLGKTDEALKMLAGRQNEERLYKRGIEREDALYARSRADAEQDAERKFKRQVQLKLMEEKLRRQKENEDWKVAVEDDASGNPTVVRYKKDGSTYQILRPNGWHDMVTGQAVPSESSAAVVSGKPTAAGSPPAAAEPSTVMGVPVGGGAPESGITDGATGASTAAPLGATPDSNRPINYEHLAKKNAEWKAKFNAEAPDKRRAALSKFREVVTKTAEAVNALDGVEKNTAPYGIPAVDAIIPDASLGAYGAFRRFLTEKVGLPSEAGDTAKYLTTLKAYGGFKQLQDMRDSSPTGGALGQVTEKEIDLLQKAFSSLDETMTTATFRKELARAQEKLREILKAADLDYKYATNQISDEDYAKAVEQFAIRWGQFREAESPTSGAPGEQPAQAPPKRGKIVEVLE